MRIDQKGSPRPLVYGTPSVLRASEKLMPGRVLEFEVGCAIRSGKVTASERGGFVFLDELGLVASVARVPGRIRP